MSSAAAPEPRVPAGIDTRGRILAAARAHFAEHGYAGTSVRMIARHLRLTDPAIHYHFPTKQSLYEALLTEPDYGDLPLGTEPLNRESLIDQVTHLFGWWTARPELGQMLLREQLASQPASLEFLEDADLSWEINVTRPMCALIGTPGEDVSRMLYEMMAGAFWDAILSYGPRVGEVVRQPYFAARIRAMVDRAIPEQDEVLS